MTHHQADVREIDFWRVTCIIRSEFTSSIFGDQAMRHRTIAIAAAAMLAASCAHADLPCSLVSVAYDYPAGNASAKRIKREFRRITDAWARKHGEDPDSVAIAMRSTCRKSPDMTVELILSAANNLN